MVCCLRAHVPLVVFWIVMSHGRCKREKCHRLLWNFAWCDHNWAPQFKVMSRSCVVKWAFSWNVVDVITIKRQTYSRSCPGHLRSAVRLLDGNETWWVLSSFSGENFKGYLRSTKYWLLDCQKTCVDWYPLSFLLQFWIKYILHTF